jgi:hypothetical protein
MTAEPADDWCPADLAFAQALRDEVTRLGWPVVKGYWASMKYGSLLDVPVEHREAFLGILRSLPDRVRG